MTGRQSLGVAGGDRPQHRYHLRAANADQTAGNHRLRPTDDGGFFAPNLAAGPVPRRRPRAVDPARGRRATPGFDVV
jgi:hypothetical protein